MFKKEIKDFIVFHFIFALVSVIIFTTIIPSGWKFFVSTVIYVIGIPIFAIYKGYKNWINYWQYLLPLSIFQVFPDWFLSSQLKVLVFPEDGFFKIGTVSLYMAGLWLIPLFIILFTGKITEQKTNTKVALITVAVTSVFIFGGSEAFLWKLGSWHAQNVRMIGNTAIYVLFPEIILGLCTFLSFNWIQNKSILIKFCSAFCVMLIYTGALMFFWFFIQ
jgi:hypothetical protein